MQTKSKNITPDYIIDIILRRRWYLILPFFICMVAGIYYALYTPKIYEATTLILIEPQRVPENYVQSIVTTDPSARVRSISEQVNSRTNIERIIRDFDLFSGDNYAAMFLEDKIEKIRQQISVDVTHTGGRRGTDINSFSISFRGKDPDKTMKIANTLSSFLIDENLKSRESQAVGTSEFLNDELNDMRSRLVEVEGRLETYRKQFMGELPEQLNSNLAILERLQTQLSDRLQSIREERSRLTVLEQVIATPAPVTRTEGQGKPSVGESSDLDILKEQLSFLTSKYTERHPDVVKVKKMIAELEKQQRIQSGTASDIASSQTPQLPIRPNMRNENYRQRQETRLAIGRLENEVADLRSQIVFYQNRVETTPEREQELSSLQRDYDNIQAAYNSLLERKLEADIAVNMERKQKGEQFQIIDSAVLPERPISPDMRKLFLIFLAAGLGIGGGLVFLLEYLDTSFRRPEDIESLGVSTLATIPVIRSHKDILFEKFNHVFSALSLLVSLSLLSGFLLLTLKGEESLMKLVSKFVQL